MNNENGKFVRQTTMMLLLLILGSLLAIMWNTTVKIQEDVAVIKSDIAVIKSQLNIKTTNLLERMK